MVIENKKIKSSIIFRPVLGKGTTAVCFFTKDKKVLKVFLDNERKKSLFLRFNMLTHLEDLSSIKVKNVYTPNDIYVKNGEVIATKLDYIKGSTLNRYVPNIPLKNFTDMLLELIETAYKLSELGVYVSDFHSKNVIINENGINVFDTDEFYVEHQNKSQYDEYLEHNLKIFLDTILSSIFKIPKRFIFDSRYLDSLYDKLYDAVVDYKDYLNFYYAIYKEFGETESLKNVSGLIKEIGRY